MRSILALRRVFAPVFVLLILGLAAPRAFATHLRGGTITWKVVSTTGNPVTSYTVQFTFTESQRWSYPGAAGTCTTSGSCLPLNSTVNLNTFTGTGSFNFGDGKTTLTQGVPDPVGTITSINQAEDYATAVFTFNHTYTVSSGGHTAFFLGTNRLSTLKLSNDTPEQISTYVQYYQNQAPVAAVPAILAVPILPTVTINLGSAVTDIDPNVKLVFRMATFQEMFGTSISNLVCPTNVAYKPSGIASGTPPGFTISNTGVVTWDTTQIHLAITNGNCGLAAPAAGDLWATQIMVDARDKTTDALITETPIDLLMKFVTATGVLPTIMLNPVGPQTVQIGTPVSFTATGNSANAGAKVTLNASGVPVGATTTGLNSSVTPPATSNFSWTPAAGQDGTYVVTYTVTDSNLQQATASETIIVATPPTATCSPAALTLPYNQAGQISATVFDPNNEVLNVTWALDGTTVHEDKGVVAYPTSTTLNLNQTYGAVGPHTVQVTATDPHGVTGTCSTPVTITAADQTINFGPLSNLTYGAPDFNVSATATSGLTVLFGSSGNCTVSGTTVHITGAGSCTITATQPGDSNYNAATPVPQSFNIGKASANITVTGYTLPYDTNPHTATGSATGVGGAALAGLDLTLTTHTEAGTYNDTWTFTDTTGNYNSTNGAVTDTISPAATTVSVVCNPVSVVYTGNPIAPCSATVNGPGLNQPLTVMYANNTTVGMATASASYAGDTNHSFSSGFQNFYIQQAPTTVTLTCTAGPFTYNGSPITPCSATLTGAGLTPSSLPVTYSNNINAGQASASASYAGDTNHTGNTGSANFTINRANLTATGGAYGPATYDGNTHPLSGCIVSANFNNLTCTNNPAGPVGPNVTSGSQPVIPVINGDTSNYNVTLTNGAYSITQAPVTATAGSYGPLTYDGNSHPLSACVVTGTYTGGLTCSNSLTSNGPVVTSVGPGVGSGITYPIFAGPTSNFAITPVTGGWSITKANLTVTAGGYGPAPYDGATHALTACSVSANFDNLTCTNSPTGPVGPDVTAVAQAVTPTVVGNTTNYNVTVNPGAYSITPAIVTAKAGSFSGVYNGYARPLSLCTVSGSYTVGVTCSNGLAANGPAVTSVGPGVGGGTVYPLLAGLNSNFTLAPLVDGSWSITKANLTLSVGGSSQYSDPVTPSFQLSGFVGNDTQANAGCTGSVATTATPGSSPEPYGVSSTLTCPNYSIGTTTGAYMISQEDATLTYTGLQYFSVPSTQTAVNVTLTYTLQDASVVLDPAASYYDSNPGDITNAAAAPISITGSYVASNGSIVNNYTTSCTPTAVSAAPGLTLTGTLLGTVPSTGTFSCTVSLPVNGTFTAASAEASGSYYRFSGGDTDVALSTSNGGSGLLTGGGYQLASYLSTNGNGTNGKYVESSPVMLLPAAGTKMNFGFITKFNKNGSNLQGNVNLIVRSQCLASGIDGTHYSPVAGSDGLCVYQIKSASQSSMADQPATSTKPGYGNVVGNAIINDVTWPNAQPVIGGGTLTLEMYDNQSGNSGTTPDTLGIQVRDNKGNLWFSNNWNGGTLKTVTTTGAPQMQGGNLTVH